MWGRVYLFDWVRDWILSCYFLASTRRLLVQTRARKAVAITRTINVAIGIACDTIETGVYVGIAIEIAIPASEKDLPSYGLPAVPTMMQLEYWPFVVRGEPGQP